MMDPGQIPGQVDLNMLDTAGITAATVAASNAATLPEVSRYYAIIPNIYYL